jgi:hypothetical protein
MSGYRLFDVTSEVLIDRRRGAFRQQSDAFLDGSARRGRRVQHGYGQRTILDDDLSASSHLGQQRGEVARGLVCRDMDCGHTHTAVSSMVLVRSCSLGPVPVWSRILGPAFLDTGRHSGTNLSSASDLTICTKPLARQTLRVRYFRHYGPHCILNRFFAFRI